MNIELFYMFKLVVMNRQLNFILFLKELKNECKYKIQVDSTMSDTLKIILKT